MKKILFIKRSLFVPLIFAILLPILFSCSKTVMNTITQTNITDTSKTYLALGDSYTIGQSVLETERFPNQTASLLRAQGIKINDPKIIATTGWTTKNLIDALNASPPQNNYDVVSLLIGVNNQYQGRSIDEYKTEFTLLLNLAIQYAGNKPAHVFVVSIPDYSVTPFASGSDKPKIAAEIDQFNLENKKRRKINII
ncbi:MAG: GDSL-type esterase/lipase family protein [Ginsengibacter sp.]